jgi:hypothetical protein
MRFCAHLNLPLLHLSYNFVRVFYFSVQTEPCWDYTTFMSTSIRGLLLQALWAWVGRVPNGCHDDNPTVASGYTMQVGGRPETRHFVLVFSSCCCIFYCNQPAAVHAHEFPSAHEEVRLSLSSPLMQPEAGLGIIRLTMGGRKRCMSTGKVRSSSRVPGNPIYYTTCLRVPDGLRTHGSVSIHLILFFLRCLLPKRENRAGDGWYHGFKEED